jgi:hypothetical protein
MITDADRILPTQLRLGDAIWDAHPTTATWARVVGLALSGEHVVVTCEGDPQPLRLPAGAPIAVQRTGLHFPDPVDEAGVDERIAGYYAGDVASAGAAVADRTLARQQGTPPRASDQGTRALVRDPSLTGIYGGDLDHVMDAVTGHEADPQASARRAAATQQRLAGASSAPAAGHADADEDTDEAVVEHMQGWYAGDLGAVVQNTDRRG